MRAANKKLTRKKAPRLDPVSVPGVDLPAVAPLPDGMLSLAAKYVELQCRTYMVLDERGRIRLRHRVTFDVSDEELEAWLDSEIKAR